MNYQNSQYRNQNYAFYEEDIVESERAYPDPQYYYAAAPNYQPSPVQPQYIQPSYNHPPQEFVAWENQSSSYQPSFGSKRNRVPEYENSSRNKVRTEKQDMQSESDLLEYKERLNRFSVNSTAGGRRYCCGYFATRKRCIVTFLTIGLILLGGIGFLIYYIFPRQPIVEFKNPLQNSNPINTLQFSSSDPIQGFLNANPNEPFTASIQFQLQFDVFSPNNIEYAFKNLTFDAFLLDADTQTKKVGDAFGSGATGRVAFPPKASTTVNLPFTVSFKLDKPIRTIQDDPNILNFIRSCGASLFPGLPPSSKPGQLWFRITGSISSILVDWTGFTPQFDRDFGFPCPASAQELSLLFQQGLNALGLKK